MRPKYILLLIFLFSALASPAKTLVEKYTDMKDVTSIYISKTMLKMFSGMNVNTGDVNISSVIPKLQSINLITTEKTNVADMMIKDFQAIKNDKKYEPLMIIKDEDSNVVMYSKYKTKDIIDEVLILITENSSNSKVESATFISLIGNLTLEDLEKLSKN
ncbi:MAG: DUF4252 domain-containing protein [Bacteroidales bacterium]|nr:DUF4252 domain-containing protein [Bacteroidales bacterium]